MIVAFDRAGLGPALVVLASAGAATSCSRAESEQPAPVRATAPSAWPAPDGDREGVCADVGDFGVCWTTTAPGISLHARALPRFPASTRAGWRCSGSGAGRICVDRARLAPAFECAGTRCVQVHPRLPSDGEWLCADSAGAVVCVGGEPPAGVADPEVDRGWHCGERSAGRGRGEELEAPAAMGSAHHGAERALGRSVCVDFSPDVPDGALSGWRCHFDYEGIVRRVCERDTGVHELGDACDASRPCVDGSRCVAARCVPPRPLPACWLDRDCERGACRFGSCSGAR